MFFAGYLGDKITLRLAKRRNGTHIPEDSLVSLIFPTIVCAIGIAVYALAANNPEKYTSWGIIMGMWPCSPKPFAKRKKRIHGVGRSFAKPMTALYRSLTPFFFTSFSGWTLQQFGFVVCIITTTHFAAEAYPSNPGPAIVLVVGAKNIVSFGELAMNPPFTRF